MAKFINPFTDVGFKIIFGQEMTKGLLDTSELDFEQSLAAMKKIIAEKVNKTIK